MAFISILLPQQNETFIIHEIEILGNELLSDDNIKFISGLSEGLSINNFNIQSSIKKLWDTKRYLDVQIDVQKKYLNNKLIIYVKEAPFINDVIIIGNNKISNKKITDKLIINKGADVNALTIDILPLWAPFLVQKPLGLIGLVK